MTGMTEPDSDCPLCPRLHAFIAEQRRDHPDWYNAPVHTFYPLEGPGSVRFLVVGLAPGLRGANRTGRPFTGDFAGDLLYGTLARFGFSEGTFDARPDDGVRLVSTAITNAVRCVPPANKPVGAEINTCRRFLSASFEAMDQLRAVLTLGKIAHDSTIRMLGGRLADHPFRHGASTQIGGYRVFSSYHCSRYNTNTGRLTEDMFTSVFSDVYDFLEKG
ncbi:uracil-DNA glycosylase [Hoeflea prorocentri]|uniref:Type-5 uracil-DNA glycosylase n=1 Tax=Hoeflea prorocentri TaxID=1922333 RepID=A0A9X3ZHL2_9HYPH|nr:uracil-DNA glycosylase [Hoeflea prorocentri]MCY6381464.1 uracil-DNA glycosylase [Hoeflea prorocentri]MDA5399264.1 uracil-DNA glycosylase [Hoeflea prorocentri]